MTKRKPAPKLAALPNPKVVDALLTDAKAAVAELERRRTSGPDVDTLLNNVKSALAVIAELAAAKAEEVAWAVPEDTYNLWNGIATTASRAVAELHVIEGEVYMLQEPKDALARRWVEAQRRRAGVR